MIDTDSPKVDVYSGSSNRRLAKSIVWKRAYTFVVFLSVHVNRFLGKVVAFKKLLILNKGF